MDTDSSVADTASWLCSDTMLWLTWVGFFIDVTCQIVTGRNRPDLQLDAACLITAHSTCAHLIVDVACLGTVCQQHR